jgi:hypothetical protein
MKAIQNVFRLVPVLAMVVAAFLLAVAANPGARGADGLDNAARALRNGPVHVDPRAQDILRRSDADALSKKIEKAGKPVLVAVFPASEEFDRATLLQDLRTKVGITGVYAVALGDRFDAGADRSVMSRQAVQNLTGAVQRSDPGDVRGMITGFVDQAVQQARGEAPSTWSSGSSADGRAPGWADLLTAVGVLAVVVGGVLLLRRRGLRRREQAERARLEALRPVVDEDITAFGEELSRIGFDPATAKADDAMLADYDQALDCYERAKATMGSARRPEDVEGVSRALEQGRFALATLEARMAGGPLPERRPPCFFDPRHGPSVEDVRWAPPGGSERTVPACAADATRLADGQEPWIREVSTPQGQRPYWESGPAYAPWAYGYFGGGLLPGLLVGTMLGNLMGSSYAYGNEFGDGGDASPQGGEYSGGDFDPGDFGGGGGFGDGGGFGGDF